MQKFLLIIFACLSLSFCLKAQQPFLIEESLIGISYDAQKLEGPLRSYVFHRFDPNQFSFSHDHYTYDPFLQTIESFRTYQIKLQYKLNRRVLINAVLPYVENKRTNQNGDKLDGWSGLGDIAIGFNYQFYEHALLKLNPLWNHKIWLGAQVYFPSGKADRITPLGEIEPQLETGKGDFQFDFKLHQISTYNNFSIRSNFLLNYSLPNKYRYRFGKQFIGNLGLDYKLQKDDWIVQPFAGIEYEWQESDFMNGQFLLDESLNGEDTGHQIFWLNVGSKLQWKQFCFIFVYKPPVNQNLYGQQLERTHQFSVDFNYILNSKR